MNGAQQSTLQALARHKDPRMTMRYTHLSDAHITAAVNRVNLGSPKPDAAKTESAYNRRK
jgi:hypothetical protein